MKRMRTIWEHGQYRIVEHADPDFSLEDLKGDQFKFDANQSIVSRKRLKELERQFEALVARHGVYGFELERWNPDVGKGWEHIDSCWGFVGQWKAGDETFDHYIVHEMIAIARGEP